jgi:hypothetical protein
VGLPLLDAALNDGGTAFADGTSIPKRYLLAFGGFPLGTDDGNGGVSGPASFVPAALGANYDLGAAIAPFAQHGDVRQRISIVSGMKIPSQAKKDPNEPIPPGGATCIGHFHANPLLTGMRSLPWVTGDITNGRVTGVTSDQIVADAIAGPSPIRLLAYRAQASFYNASSAPDGHDAMSYRSDGMGGVNQETPVTSPQAAYASMFNLFTPSDPAEAAKQALELDKRRSVLDLVDRRMGGLVPRLGAADRQKIERHYDAVRELENTLAAIAPPATGACTAPADPGSDPPLGGDPGSGYDINQGYSGEEERLKSLVDLMHMAMTCDVTRVGTLMFTMLQSWMNCYPIIGVQRSAHAITHFGNPAELDLLIAWHMKHFAYLVAKFRDTPEGSGSLLDSCAIGFLIECGYGMSYEVSPPAVNAHSYENMACLVAGGAGGLRQGEHISLAQSANKHPANVLLSLMNAVGVPATTLGEVSGVAGELF